MVINLKRRNFLYGGIGLAVAAGVAISAKSFAPSSPLSPSSSLTIYSGRGEKLVGPVIKSFEEETGIIVQVRYGATAELALAIIEEGKNSPADLYWAQDAGSLGALAKEGRLLKIPDRLLDMVDPRFRSPRGEWIGITGRARTVDYNTELVDKSDLPDTIWGFLDPRWKGKIGWAPANGSFQAFITALRKIEGEDKAREWLLGIIANDPQIYPKNSPIVAALGRGEIHVGFVNNYYLHRFQAVDPSFPVAHHYTKGDAGTLINVAGLSVIRTTKNPELAERFIDYMLAKDAQSYFAINTFEYPLAQGLKVLGSQRSIDEILTPNFDLSDLDDIRGTLKLLREVRALP